MASYPGLELEEPGIWRGALRVWVAHDEFECDEFFQVEIVAGAEYPRRPPALREVGGRTLAIARKHMLTDVRDLHFNPENGTACVCALLEERVRFPAGSDFTTFVERLAIPYLFGLSYYDKFGRWPGPEYAHGAIGILEYLGEHTPPLDRQDISDAASVVLRERTWKEYSKQIRNPRGFRNCLCGSNRRISKCHAEAWRGVLHLHQELRRLQINAFHVFRPASKAPKLAGS